ncbi:MAG: DNA repair protein RecO, partial [Patescibacteria group bacterium]
MTEYFTEAIVLDRKESGEADGLLILYTQDLGKITAKAKSLRKITSKLSGHLQPLNLIKVRLIEKNGFQAVDALSINGRGFKKGFKREIATFAKFLRILDFIREMTFELHPDYRLWTAMKKLFSHDGGQNIEEKIIYRGLLKILGFDPQFAECALCRKKEAKFFLKEDHLFFCGDCGWKNKEDEVVL